MNRDDLTQTGEDTAIANPYWISFTDIMSGLLLIFILACVLLFFELQSVIETKEKDTQALKRIESVWLKISQGISDSLSIKGVYVDTSQHRVIRIPEKILHFESNEFSIPPHMKKGVETIGIVLENLLNKNESSLGHSIPLRRWIDTIFIEGHTDSVRAPNFAIKVGVAPDKGNWALSTFRAIAVWDLWSTTSDSLRGNLMDTKNNEGEPLFSVSGYGESRPVPHNRDNMTNRRIDVRFAMIDIQQFRTLRDSIMAVER